MCAVDCSKFNDFLFRRTPHWDHELTKDRFPTGMAYLGLYQTETWPSFTGYQHTWDQVHVTVPSDDGNWEAINSDACATNICDPGRVMTGWGSTRNTYTKYHRDYQSPVFCFDQLRHVEEAVQQLEGIIKGHRKIPDQVSSDFIRLRSLQGADKLYICGSALTELTVGSGVTFPTTRQINLLSSANLPTSKITMPYLQHYAPQLLYKGYFDQEFVPDGKFLMFGDIQSIMELCNANPALTQMYNAADFAKGGKFFQFGAMTACGNFIFKVDPTPLRYQRLNGSGLLGQVLPYQNVAATVGKKPQFDPNYELAPYQLFHIYARAARKVFIGDAGTPVSKDMPFMTRNLAGKWSWKNPDYFRATDPNTGTVCEYQNDKKNKGYFLAEFEMGFKAEHPEIEMWILAKREAAAVSDLPTAATAPDANTMYQTLTPYNGPWCAS